MPARAESLRITDRYRANLAAVTKRALYQAHKDWRRVDYEKLDESFRFVHSGMVITVAAAQREAVRMTSGYFAAYMSSELGEKAKIPTLRMTDYVGKSFNEKTLDESLQSAVIKVKIETMKNPSNPDRTRPVGTDPMGEGLKALLAGVDLNVKAAARAALKDLIDKDERVIGWKRATKGTCGACAGLAESATSPPGTPLEIHPSCQCVSEAVVRNVPQRVSRPTGAEIFAGLTVAEQNETYGESIAQALREGRITFADLVMRDGGFIKQRPAEDLNL